MYFIVYKTTNKINGKYYIGKHKTDNIEDGYIGSGILLSRAIKKYGKKNFEREILHVFDNEYDMALKESQLVDPTDPQNYNLCPGGKGGNNMWGKSHSAETRQKISLALQGYKYSEERNKKISQSWSAERRSQQSIIMRDRTTNNYENIYTQDRARKISIAKTGIPKSAETRQKISEAAKRRIRKPHTEETKRKMREAWQSRRT